MISIDACICAWFNNMLKSNTIRCKKLATIVLSQKNVAQTLLQAITGKHECWKVTAMCGTRAYLLSTEEGSCYIFSTQNNCCEFLASNGIIFKVIFNHTWYVAVILHSCLPVFACRRVVLHFFDPKQLLRVSCILWWYLSKWFSTILQNASLLCCIFVLRNYGLHDQWFPS